MICGRLGLIDPNLSLVAEVTMASANCCRSDNEISSLKRENGMFSSVRYQVCRCRTVQQEADTFLSIAFEEIQVAARVT